MSRTSPGQWQREAHLAEALLVAQSRLGSTYAGSVIDNRTKSWNLYSTTDVPSSTMTAIRKAPSRPIRISVVKVARSYEQLLQIQKLVIDLAMTPGGSFVHGTSIKPADNQVHVDLDASATNALVAQVLNLAPVGAIQIGNSDAHFGIEGGEAATEPEDAGERLGKAESNLDGRPPYKAGKYGAPVYQWDGADGAMAFGMHFAVRFIDGEREGGCFARIPQIERAATVKLLMR